jgi:diguanylate cyclase (GGDEF)-like protein/PAS domain S-box-containing protein
MQASLCIRDITDIIPPVAPECTNSVVYETFRDNSDLMVVAVADAEGHVLGLVERHTFNLTMAAEYGRALYGNKPVTTLMDEHPLMVELDMPLREFTRANLSERPSELMRGFIATQGGLYAGVGTSLSILRATSQDLHDALTQQRGLTEDLIRLSRDSKRQEAFLDMVIQNIPAMVVVKNAADQRIMLINPVGEDVLELAGDRAIGHTAADLMPAARAEFFETYDRKALMSNQPIIFDEVEVSQSDGTTRVMQFKKTVLRTPMGEPDAILTLGIDLTDQKLAESRIQHLAHYDSLTGLANRTLFSSEIENALARVQRHEHQIALLCLDLDRFKVVNDSYGHLIGDQLLTEVAERMRACVRKGDTIARMGGDEFAIIQQIGAPDDARQLASRIVAALREPVQVGSMALEVGVSIGIVIAPEDGMDAKNLLSRADMAMYSVKSEGRNGWRFYSADMDAHLQSRLELEKDLRQALAEGQLEVHYQPLLDLHSGEIVSFEALTRWRHPVRGYVSPAEFIPLAEECGLISELGEWVLRTACRTAALWPVPWRVAVNISPLQFRRRSLVSAVRKALKSAGLPPQRLELEITESVILENEERNLGLLNALRAMGVRIAMDDFGTGYSSLSYLRSFPFDKIKIDQSFVRDLPNDDNAMSIIRAIIDMARSLDVRITAEGVETEAQMAALRALNCAEAQGYLIGKPLPDVATFHPVAEQLAS